MSAVNVDPLTGPPPHEVPTIENASVVSYDQREVARQALMRQIKAESRAVAAYIQSDRDAQSFFQDWEKAGAEVT